MGTASFTNPNIGVLHDAALAEILRSILNRSTSAAGLAVAGIPAANAYFKTANTLQYSINGVAASKAATDNVNMVTGSIRRGGVRVTAGGTGYALDDVLTLTGGSGTAKVLVTGAVSGVVTEVQLLASGYSHTVSTGNATSGGTGSGCTIEITSVEAFAVQAVSTFCNYLVTIDSAGSFVTTQGLQYSANTTLQPTDSSNINLPDCPLGQAPVGIVNVATNAATTFTVGTTLISAAGVTDLYYDLSSVAKGVLQL